MLDTIRRKLMRRFQVNRTSIAKMSGKLCPKIQVKVDKAEVKASECLLMYSGEGKYEVDYRQQKFVVNLREKTYDCKKLDISGIPCHHAISVILHEESKIEDYVNHCYTIEKYKKSYELIIHPMPSMEQWTRTQYDPVDSPLERYHFGIPKRQRKRDPTGPRNPYRFSKFGTNIKCSVCKKFGYNSRTCPLAKKKKSKTCSKGKKKGAVTVGARTSGQAAACERLASAGGGSGSADGATSNAARKGNGATRTGSAAGGNGASSSGVMQVEKSKWWWCQ
ncbi:hypothetical protein FCV25MIE_03852 [Fagus crenata]